MYIHTSYLLIYLFTWLVMFLHRDVLFIHSQCLFMLIFPHILLYVLVSCLFTPVHIHINLLFVFTLHLHTPTCLQSNIHSTYMQKNMHASIRSYHTDRGRKRTKQNTITIPLRQRVYLRLPTARRFRHMYFHVHRLCFSGCSEELGFY